MLSRTTNNHKMCEGGGSIWFDDSFMIKDYSFRDRRSNLNALENYAWQESRRNSKGKLLEIKRRVNAYALLNGVRNLSRIEHRVLEPQHALILSYIPVEINLRYAKGNYFAFIVLAGEEFYLIAEYEVLDQESVLSSSKGNNP